MEILVIGGRGREHAIVSGMVKSKFVAKIWCAPGNAGIGEERLKRNGNLVECVQIGADDLPKLLAFAEEKKPDLTIVGPEGPLSLGIVDLFEKRGLAIFGPNQNAAMFESSKAFACLFMERHGIPAPLSGIFYDPDSAMRAAYWLGWNCAVKADGLASGRGALICRDKKTAEEAIRSMLVEGKYGKAGERIVVQELLDGEEISIHALADGKTAKLFPTAQDHKRAFDDERVHNPNTGGMGAYSPTPFLSPQKLAELERQILKPWLLGCAKERFDFRGIIYPGIMLTKTGPKVLEFNSRFGDPEAQAYIPLLENDLMELFFACIQGTLNHFELRFKPETAVSVVMASGGYPDKFAIGKVITGLADAAKMPGVKIFHAGTAKDGDKIVTSDGRVLSVTALGKNLQDARDKAYAAVEQIKFEGAYFRKGIGASGLAFEKSKIG